MGRRIFSRHRYFGLGAVMFGTYWSAVHLIPGFDIAGIMYEVTLRVMDWAFPPGVPSADLL